MLEEFEGWLRTNVESLRQKGIHVELKSFNTAPLKHVEPYQINKAAYADFVSNKYLGRVAVWENGACDIDILNMETGKPIWWTRYDLTTPDEFDYRFATSGERRLAVARSLWRERLRRAAGRRFDD